ncbi:universal stress protein [Fusibacter sp. JL298sf-3]
MKHKKRVLVCVTQQKSCERLIDFGVNLIKTDNDELHVIHVVKENWKYFGQLEEQDALEYLFEVSKKQNAMLTVIKAKDIEKTLADFSEENKITDIVMGESLEKSEQQNMINRLQDKTRIKVRFQIVPLDFTESGESKVIETPFRVNA